MPIFRYFIFVGGALLSLLLAVNFVLPASTVTQPVATASNDQPLIRIRSDRHLPERVVLDTSQPTIAPAVKTAAASQAAAQDGVSPALAEMSAKARVRETFAQFTPAVKVEAAKKVDAKPQVQAQAQPIQTTAPQGQVQVPAQPKRKVAARAHSAPQQQGRPMMVMAQRPQQYGFFNNTW